MQVPTPVAREGLVLPLSQEIEGNPAAKDGLQLMEVSAGGGAQAAVLSSEATRPERKVWRYHKTAHILS